MTDEIVLRSAVSNDAITERISNAFDYDPNGEIITRIKVPIFPSDYNIGLIVGSSGSGKTTLLKTAFGWNGESIKWDNTKCIASNFSSFEEASEKFGAVGLNSIPTWLKPYSVLSNGEKFRADMAKRLQSEAIIDEFTSVVNREVATSCCISLEKYIRRNNLQRVTFSSCHDDVIQYLQPDWVYNTDTHKFYNGRYLCKPKIDIAITGCKTEAWDMFKRYHYLSGDINKSSQCYIGTYDDIPIAFGAILSMPCGSLTHAYREHRIVVLPDYQGMGIGNHFSEAIADAYHRAGCRYFSKTANPRMGDHRDKSSLWKATSKNHKNRSDYLRMRQDFHGMLNTAYVHAKRVCFSHEYIGDGKQYPYIINDIDDNQMTIFDYFGIGV